MFKLVVKPPNSIKFAELYKDSAEIVWLVLKHFHLNFALLQIQSNVVGFPLTYVQLLWEALWSHG